MLTYDKNKTDVALKAGGRHAVDVEYSGVPTPVISWKKDGEDLADLSIIETRDSVSRLAIGKLKMSDSGHYTITAENSVGRDTATFMVDVKGKSPLTWLLSSLD